MEQINFRADKKEVDKAVKKARKELGLTGVSSLLRYLVKKYLFKGDK